MKFLADLHIHSKYSMATGKNADLENNYISALTKGISVVGTGDFTHPAWFAELSSKLEPDGSGLFKLKKEIIKELNFYTPLASQMDMKFMLQCEISSIYKKNGKVRKIHNLVFFPSLESVKKFNAKLDAIGNIKSDGRPILGLDARSLLEIVLDTDPEAFLIPAHIWTPWFSLFGSKSGFNKIEECFEDLSSEIFALETGLSSDPEMNWMVSDLDRFSLISNSDAHSPAKIGREANIFDSEMTYEDIKGSLKNKDKRFKGTFEFFPEEGKYHYDGHRKCNVCLSPSESAKYKGICPVCGKKMTLGVLYRISELSDRENVDEIKKQAPPFYSIVPLTALLSEILNVGPNTKKVKKAYDDIIDITGSEFNALWWADYDLMEKTGIPLLKEAVERMRTGNIKLIPGYDGEFGKIKIFDEKELSTKTLVKGQKVFFPEPEKLKNKAIDLVENNNRDITTAKKLIDKINDLSKEKQDLKYTKELNEEQKKAVLSNAQNLVIIAGPGTGKTSTLTSKIYHLIFEKNIDPDKIAALTFTVKAAEEMKERLLKKGVKKLPFTGTFHNFCITQLKEYNKTFNIMDEATKKFLLKTIINKSDDKISIKKALEQISLLKSYPDFYEQIQTDNLVLYKKYEELQAYYSLKDFDDILLDFLKLKENESDNSYKETFSYVLVDEFQDLNKVQYEILKKISSKKTSVFAIGDPDQSIYGFRGGDFDFLPEFTKDYKDVCVFNLKQNYRSTENIIDASYQIISAGKNTNSREKVYSGINSKELIHIIKSPTEKIQAVFMALEIQKLIGGTGHHMTYRDSFEQTGDYSFSDIAVLCRTRKEADLISSIFDDNSIPHSKLSETNINDEKGFNKLFSYMKMLNLEPDISDYLLNPFGLRPDFENLDKYNSFIKDVSVKLDCLKKCLKATELSEIIDFIILNTDIKDLFEDENLKTKIEFVKKISINYNNISEFLTDIKLNRVADFNVVGEKVNIMTVHSAKGLEFPVVFIPGCVEGVFPFFKGDDTESSDIEEERRLFYVGVTRAKERLYLISPDKIEKYGQVIETKASRFLSSLEQNIKDEKEYKHKKKIKKSGIQLSLFD